MPDRKKLTVDPASAKPAEPASTSGIRSSGGNDAAADTEGNDDMNMMSKVGKAPLAETGFANVLARAEGKTLRMWDAGTAPAGTPAGLIVGSRLPMLPMGTSPDLAEMVRSWGSAHQASGASRTDEELNAACDLICEHLEAIRDFEARSAADIAAKLGISAFTLNGAGQVEISGITDDGELLIQEEYALDWHAETMLIAAAKDAERIGREQVNDPVWDTLLADYHAALGAEREYMAKNIDPVVDQFEPGAELDAAIGGISAETWAEDERLSNIRYEIEDRLMAHPAPDGAAFAEKFLIAYGEGREASGWNDMLEGEARRFAPSRIAVIQPATASAPARGTHPICDDERDLFVDLPDLRTGRSLEDALVHLDRIAAIDPSTYPEEWHEEIRDVGGSAYVNYTKEGDRQLYAGQPCDAQEQERRRRVDALCKHMRAIDGMSDRVADFLERRGHCTDNRPRDMRETTAAIREFLSAGFRVFIWPDDRLGTSASLPQEWVEASEERGNEILQAAGRFSRARRRWRNEAQIKRAVRMLGKLHEGSRCVVLEREA